MLTPEALATLLGTSEIVVLDMLDLDWKADTDGMAALDATELGAARDALAAWRTWLAADAVDPVRAYCRRVDFAARSAV